MSAIKDAVRTREENDYRATQSARILKQPSKYKGAIVSRVMSLHRKEGVNVRNKAGKLLLSALSGRMCEYR